jgi:hypothetical protein
VRWFEIDHPATQADKRLRLGRLSIEVSQIEFIALDVTCSDLDAALLDRGWNPDGSSLMLCESLAIYLDASVLQTMFESLRALAGVGTRLALSVPPEAMDPDQRARLRAAIAAIGEPARNSLSADDTARMLAAARWLTVEVSERSRQAGFAVAAPAWEPSGGGRLSTASRVGRCRERLYDRRRIDGLPRHLGDRYGINVSGMRRLDVGVFLVERRDGPSWVARVFAPQRPLAASHGDAEILRFLEQVEFPAERCAHPHPVTSHEGQGVVVTEHIPGKATPPTQATFRLLGDPLGQLHTLTEPATTRTGGAWHRLASHGGPSDEIAACIELLDAGGRLASCGCWRPPARVPSSQRALYDTVVQTASGVENGDQLPRALIHPDFVRECDHVGCGAPRRWSTGRAPGADRACGHLGSSCGRLGVPVCGPSTEPSRAPRDTCSSSEPSSAGSRTRSPPVR